MLDEDAFGLLISYFCLEDDEYAGERSEFVERYVAFAELVREHLATSALGESARAFDFGHAVYVELLDAEERPDLIGWLKSLRSKLGEQSYESAGVLTYGSSWRSADEPQPDSVDAGGTKLTRISLPSEPLRRALLAEAATHADEEAGTSGWGAGLYLDVDAVDALGRKPKNAPTILMCAGARFFRAGS